MPELPPRRLPHDLKILTVEQLHHETDLLRREFLLQKEILETRIKGNEEASKTFAENLGRIPTTLDREISRVQALIEASNTNVQLQFKERDVRLIDAQQAQKEAAAATAKAAEVGVAAALQAQKEASAAQNDSNNASIAKSENSTNRQLENMNDKIATINARLDRTEGKSTGLSSNLATGIAAIAVLVALLSATGVFSGGKNIPQSPAPGPQGSVTLPIPNVPAIPR